MKLKNTAPISAVCVLSLSILFGCEEQDSYFTMTGYAQGSEYHITFCDRDGKGNPIPHERITSVADSILKEVENTLSGYNPNSTLSIFNAATDSMEVSGMFTELFEISRRLYFETDSLFDVSSAPLFDFWGFGFRDPEKMAALRGSSTTPSAVDSIRTFTGMDHIALQGNTLVKDDPRARLNFNAIAQGYTCDLIAREFDRIGMESYLIDVGMEIACKGHNAKGNAWRIGIDAPVDGNMTAGENIKDVVEVTDCGIVTSGNYRKFFIDENGEKYAHSINPVTGYPARDSLLSATVIAPNATMADAYATYCMVLGYEKAVKYLESRSDLHGCLITPHTTYKKL